MYNSLHQRLQQILPETDRLIVEGYSFMDELIDTVISNSLFSIKEVININPNTKFKFEHPDITEIDPLQQQVQF